MHRLGQGRILSQRDVHVPSGLTELRKMQKRIEGADQRAVLARYDEAHPLRAGQFIDVVEQVLLFSAEFVWADRLYSQLPSLLEGGLLSTC